MEPNFSRSFHVTIRKWQPSVIESLPPVFTQEVVTVLAQDFSEAVEKGEEYIRCIKENSATWKVAEIVGASLDTEIFLGIKVEEEIEECHIPPTGWKCTREPNHEGPCAAIPQTGILTEGFKGYPCCHE